LCEDRGKGQFAKTSFDGKISEWQEFWSIFCCSIHKQNLPVVSKFTYLKTVLRGTALAAVAGIPVTGDNYPLAIKTLKERFGKKEAIVEMLYSKLQNMPRSGSNFGYFRFCRETVKAARSSWRGSFQSENLDNIQIPS